MVEAAGRYAQQDQTSGEWALVTCGYAYKGARVTNNVCEFAALQDGLEFARAYLRDMATHLEIIGDSNLTIDSKHGFSKITAAQLHTLGTHVTDFTRHGQVGHTQGDQTTRWWTGLPTWQWTPREPED